MDTLRSTSGDRIGRCWCCSLLVLVVRLRERRHYGGGSGVVSVKLGNKKKKGIIEKTATEEEGRESIFA